MGRFLGWFVEIVSLMLFDGRIIKGGLYEMGAIWMGLIGTVMLGLV